MRRFISSLSLRAQFLILGGFTALITAAGVMGAMIAASEHSDRLDPSSLFHTRLTMLAIMSAAGGLTLMLVAINRVVQALWTLRDGMKKVIGGELESFPTSNAVSADVGRLQSTFEQMVRRLREAREENAAVTATLAERTRTVDRLLDFSQTIQGAGRAEQVYTTLAHFLHTELSLDGVVILAHDPDSLPNVQAKASLPADFLCNSALGDMDHALCPCLRQSQPRHFKPESPVRCAIDQFLKEPSKKPGYCLPFGIGRKVQYLVHMLLPPNEVWTEQRRQLAQTYVNTAQSFLTSLNLLCEAEQQSLTDALTGLYNRRSMETLLQREVALSERHNRPLTIFMVDMDLFKQVNDTHGHAAGDHLLRAFADCVRITLRKTDLAFRYGGDEFVVCLPTTPLAQAQQVVQKLRQAFSSVDFSSAIAHLDHQPTLSIGIAERSVPQNVLSLPNLLAAADQALYEAKAANRNCVKTYVPPQAA